MSMKPFTNEELDITQKERVAMIKMRKLLLRTKVAGVKTDYYGEKDRRACLMPNFNGPTFFKMDISAGNWECGTVCCIGGGMALLMGMSIQKAAAYVENHFSLNDLFYPTYRDGGQLNYEKITPKRAAQAIENFLFYGRPRWQTIVPQK